jgi:hypothetical protein
MSSDNGVYILITKHPIDSNQKEYRVAYAAGIDNIYFDPNWNAQIDSWELAEVPEGTWNEECVLNFFDCCGVFSDTNLALQEAQKIYNEWGHTEYGICTLDFSHKVFPLTRNVNCSTIEP